MSEKRRDNKGRILRNGEVQRSDGKYMYRYVDLSGKRQCIYSWKLVDTDKIPDGKRCPESLREMEKKINRDLEDGIQADSDKTTVDELFETFLAMRSDLKLTTQSNYRCLYESYAKDSLGFKSIGRVKHSDIHSLYLDMLVEQQLKPATVRGLHAVIYQMFELAVKDSMLRANPASNAYKDLNRNVIEEQKHRNALTKEQQEAFISFAYSKHVYQRWAPLFTVLLGTGMRIGEALGLRWDDCDFENGIISVNHSLLYKPDQDGKYEYRISEPKTRSGFREIPMLDDVKTTLIQLKQQKADPRWTPFVVDGYTGFIFLNNSGKVFTPGAVYTSMQNLMRSYNKAEIKSSEQDKREPMLLPKFSPHILRHTFCTRLCENESNVKIVQEVMGHKHIATTMDIYNEVTSSAKQTSLCQLNGKIKIK